MNKRLYSLSLITDINSISSPTLKCNWRNESYPCKMCSSNPEPVNFLGNYARNQNNAYSNPYNPRRRNHPNFSWGNQCSSSNPMPSNPPSCEPHMRTFPQPKKKLTIEEMMLQVMTSQAATLKNLENQMGQISSALSSHPLGGPSDTESNPKGVGREYCNVVTLRSGKQVEVKEKLEAEWSKQVVMSLI